jgi:hypothetical protein
MERGKRKEGRSRGYEEETKCKGGGYTDGDPDGLVIYSLPTAAAPRRAGSGDSPPPK